MVGGPLRVLPTSSTTKAGRHDIAKSGVKHKKSNQIMFTVQSETCHDKSLW
jgi:hypothetical protein